MYKGRQKRECAIIVRMLALASCSILFFACGDKQGDNGTVTGFRAVEEEVTGQELEPLQETVESSVEDQNAVDENKESQETVDVADGGATDEESADLAQYNKKRFFECAAKWEVDKAEAESHYQRLCDDNVFRNQTAWLVWADMEDLDQNGQPDMAVMVKDDEYSGYGEGCIYF